MVFDFIGEAIKKDPPQYFGIAASLNCILRNLSAHCKRQKAKAYSAFSDVSVSSTLSEVPLDCLDQSSNISITFL